MAVLKPAPAWSQATSGPGRGNYGYAVFLELATCATIDGPNGVEGSTAMTVVNGLNDKGQLVGFYLDAAGHTDSMLVQVSGRHGSWASALSSLT